MRLDVMNTPSNTPRASNIGVRRSRSHGRRPDGNIVLVLLGRDRGAAAQTLERSEHIGLGRKVEHVGEPESENLRRSDAQAPFEEDRCSAGSAVRDRAAAIPKLTVDSTVSASASAPREARTAPRV